MFDILTELNNQANKICDDLRAAKRAVKARDGSGKAPKKADVAYHRGRAEELEKWLASVEALIVKITESREQRKKEGQE